MGIPLASRARLLPAVLQSWPFQILLSRSPSSMLPLCPPPPEKVKKNISHKIQHLYSESIRRNKPKACVWPLTRVPLSAQETPAPGPQPLRGLWQGSSDINVHK